MKGSVVIAIFRRSDYFLVWFYGVISFVAFSCLDYTEHVKWESLTYWFYIPAGFCEVCQAHPASTSHNVSASW